MKNRVRRIGNVGIDRTHGVKLRINASPLLPEALPLLRRPEIFRPACNAGRKLVGDRLDSKTAQHPVPPFSLFLHRNRRDIVLTELQRCVTVAQTGFIDIRIPLPRQCTQFRNQLIDPIDIDFLAVLRKIRRTLHRKRGIVRILAHPVEHMRIDAFLMGHILCKLTQPGALGVLPTDRLRLVPVHRRDIGIDQGLCRVRVTHHPTKNTFRRANIECKTHFRILPIVRVREQFFRAGRSDHLNFMLMFPDRLHLPVVFMQDICIFRDLTQLFIRQNLCRWTAGRDLPRIDQISFCQTEPPLQLVHRQPQRLVLVRKLDDRIHIDIIKDRAVDGIVGSDRLRAPDLRLMPVRNRPSTRICSLSGAHLIRNKVIVL